MNTNAAASSSLTFRAGTRADLEAIVTMLADDPVARAREPFRLPLPESYLDAFEAISRDPGTELVVAHKGHEIAGVFQITFTPYLSYGGSWRATIEGVRVATALRGQGIGTEMMRHAINLAEERGCNLVQLTTDARRADAKRFYERLGFEATHVGMKLRL